jgi:carbon monoxide dehydrogenase subunit G
MEIKGERIIAATQQTVWNAINDPAILKLCIPGCESIERVDESTLKAVVMAKIGPVKARFTGKVTMADVVAPDSCTLHFEGVGGPAGFAKGQATVALTALAANETQLVYNASAAVGGKLGQIGARLIESAARAISDEFFNHLSKQLSPVQQAPASAIVTSGVATSGVDFIAPPAAADGATAAPLMKPVVAPAAAASPGYLARPHVHGAHSHDSHAHAPHAAGPAHAHWYESRTLLAIGCIVLGFILGKV